MPILKRALAAALLVALPLAAPPAQAQDEGEEYHFTYDGADNLLSRTVVRDGVATEQTMPLDGSGRNRPSSVGGVSLEWDANGNLKRKGDLYLAYDFRNRLTQVKDAQGTVLATYVYDAFNRRVEQRIGGDVIATAWDGQRPIETYVNGTLQTRRTYGLGLDEIVSVEHDLDGDGVLEQRYTPIYGSSGNLAVITDTNGKPIERYSYSPYGGQRIYVDATPPRLDQVRVIGGELWLEVSDVANTGAVTAALDTGKLRLQAGSETLPLSYDRTEVHARRHRVELALEEPPAAGTALTLHVEPEAILDLFHNTLTNEVLVPFAWPEEDTVIFDAHAPEVHEVAYREAVLEVELTEEIDLATAAPSIQIAGYTPTWTKSSDGYRLVASAPLPAGTHNLLITDGLTDLAGTGLSQPFVLQFTVEPEEPLRVAYREPDLRLTSESTIANELGFHGLPKDPLTGFLYARNRYLDPDLGRFITPDPMGYADSPNAYQYAGNSPANYTDPLGLLLRVSGFERTTIQSLYGEGNVGFEQVGDDLYEVSVNEAGLAHFAEYVNRTGGTTTFLNEAILSPFYQYTGLSSVYPRNGKWIGQQYEGMRVPGMPPGMVITSPDNGAHRHGTAFGPVPITQWRYTTPGRIHEAMDFMFSPENMLLVLSLMTAAPGDEEAALGLTLGRTSRALPRGAPLALGRGSTASLARGTTLARNLRHQLAIEQAMASPAAGRQLPITMSDPRWPASRGWVKMQQIIETGGVEGPINVHYVFNPTTGAVDDFKIVLPGPR